MSKIIGECILFSKVVYCVDMRDLAATTGRWGLKGETSLKREAVFYLVKNDGGGGVRGCASKCALQCSHVRAPIASRQQYRLHRSTGSRDWLWLTHRSSVTEISLISRSRHDLNTQIKHEFSLFLDSVRDKHTFRSLPINQEYLRQIWL